jgi:hypothetical protein
VSDGKTDDLDGDFVPGRLAVNMKLADAPIIAPFLFDKIQIVAFCARSEYPRARDMAE